MQCGQLMTISDIARELGVERHLAGQYVRQMPCVVIGRIKRVRQSDFEHWLTEHTQTEERRRAPARSRRAAAFDPSLFEPDGTLKRRA